MLEQARGHKGAAEFYKMQADSDLFMAEHSADNAESDANEAESCAQRTEDLIQQAYEIAERRRQSQQIMQNYGNP